MDTVTFVKWSLSLYGLSIILLIWLCFWVYKKYKNYQKEENGKR